MTPQEKAEQLFDLFDRIPRYAKRAVDEIINQFDVHPSVQTHFKYDKLMYWQKVKQEIEKL
jgi:hypothetical protein